MSLILGLHLLERFYLVSDTRVTSESNKSDLVVIRDNLIKTFNFNSRISALAAGTALPASYVLNKLKQKITANTTIEEFKSIVSSSLRPLVSEYVNSTGFHSGKVAIIFAGFNLEKGKEIEVSLLGNAMSAMVRAVGEGTTVNQSIDNRLRNALGGIGGKKKGDHIKVNDVFTSEMFSVVFNVRTAEIETKSVDCYEYAVFHPKQNIKTVPVPEELLSNLEFRERLSKSGEDQLYEEAQVLINFVRRTSKKYELWTVGGHVMVLLQTPNGNLFPTGDFGKIKDGKVVKFGSFFVRGSNLMYELEDGTIGEYRHI